MKNIRNPGHGDRKCVVILLFFRYNSLLKWTSIFYECSGGYLPRIANSYSKAEKSEKSWFSHFLRFSISFSIFCFKTNAIRRFLTAFSSFCEKCSKKPSNVLVFKAKSQTDSWKGPQGKIIRMILLILYLHFGFKTGSIWRFLRAFCTEVTIQFLSQYFALKHSRNWRNCRGRNTSIPLVFKVKFWERNRKRSLI